VRKNKCMLNPGTRTDFLFGIWLQCGGCSMMDVGDRASHSPGTGRVISATTQKPNFPFFWGGRGWGGGRAPGPRRGARADSKKTGGLPFKRGVGVRVEGGVFYFFCFAGGTPRGGSVISGGATCWVESCSGPPKWGGGWKFQPPKRGLRGAGGGFSGDGASGTFQCSWGGKPRGANAFGPGGSGGGGMSVGGLVPWGAGGGPGPPKGKISDSGDSFRSGLVL